MAETHSCGKSHQKKNLNKDRPILSPAKMKVNDSSF